MVNSSSESFLESVEINWDNPSAYGDFELLHAGSYADTYRAKRAGRYFLMKALHSQDKRHLAMLRREYEISIGLEHPNIAGTITFENDSEVGPCIVMEYVDGFPLSDFLCTNPDSRTRKALLIQLLDAVAYLHAKGVIHNDLKPENILVTAKGNRLKLIDFGLSDDDAHYLITTPGFTAQYAAPELIGKTGPVDGRSDIFSLGILISLLFPTRYKCIAGKCRRQNPESRYSSVAALLRSIRQADTRRWTLPAVLLLLILSAVIAPRLISRMYYSRTVSQIESMYADTLSAHGMDVQAPSPVSYEAYQKAGTTHRSRQDALAGAAERDLNDLLLCQSAEKDLDRLFDVFSGSILERPDEPSRLLYVADFARAFTARRDSCLAALSNESTRDSFYARCEILYNGMTKDLYSRVKQPASK